MDKTAPNDAGQHPRVAHLVKAFAFAVLTRPRCIKICANFKAYFCTDPHTFASVSLTFDASINLNERLSLRGRENSITLKAPCILM